MSQKWLKTTKETPGTNLIRVGKEKKQAKMSEWEMIKTTQKRSETTQTDSKQPNKIRTHLNMAP